MAERYPALKHPNVCTSDSCMSGLEVLSGRVHPGIPDRFDSLMGQLGYPMYIVTTSSEEAVSGCLVGFTTQCSIDPHRFLVCLSRTNRTFRVAHDAEYLAVHLVPADREDLAEIFGELTSDDVDKLELCEWERGPHGVPIVSGCPNWFAGRVLERFELGDHFGFLLEPITVSDGGKAEALFADEVADMKP